MLTCFKKRDCSSHLLILVTPSHRFMRVIVALSGSLSNSGTLASKRDFNNRPTKAELWPDIADHAIEYSTGETWD